jgi:L-iditol 2-dehydrogenase
LVKAIVKTDRVYGGVKVLDLPVPEIQDDEVLLRVKAASICGSDVHLYRFAPTHHFVQTPIIMGHEYAGVVERVGSKVQGFQPGDRVAAEAVAYCGECRPCKSGKKHLCQSFQIAGMHRAGGFAEYVVVKPHLLHHLPADLHMEHASWVEPTSVVVHAVYDRSRISSDDLVLVTGPGPIGLLAAQVAKVKGATVIVAGVDADEEMRLPMARRLGLHAVNLSKDNLADWLKEYFGRETVDWVVECSGASPVVGQLLGVVEKGSGITFVGLFPKPVQIDDFTTAVRKELDLFTSFSSTPANYEEAMKLLASGEVHVQEMSAPYEVEAAEQAFEDTVARKVLKPVFSF